MKELDLYKFIQSHNVEYHWLENDVMMFVNVWNIEEFLKMLPNGIFDDSGVECIAKQGYFVFMMQTICSYCDIELDRIFTDKNR